VITREEAGRLRDELLAVLEEDARNTDRLLARLDSITEESGIGAHAALLLILTHLPFEEGEARRHWQAVLAHRDAFSRGLGRDAGIRVALLDYFMNINRRLVQPTLIDLEMGEAVRADGTCDVLTGLTTDRKFRAAVQAELRRARRYGQQATVVVVDVDDFASINDRFGALVGDRLLRELAILLKNNVRDIDTVARLGEDEMALLLPETGRNSALAVAERFRLETETFFATRESGGKPVNLTVSVGVACYPDDAATPHAILERAAQALYQAKATGRNAVELYRPERRRFLRFDLDPTRFEIEVLGPAERGSARLRNYSRNGILFSSPEPLEVGESVEIRLLESEAEGPGGLRRLAGRVVRLEELPPPPPATAGESVEQSSEDLYEVGVALDEDAGTGEVLELLERARRGSAGWPS
jgi:diguanylate cyclase (GGDEF)-like protein